MAKKTFTWIIYKYNITINSLLNLLNSNLFCMS